MSSTTGDALEQVVSAVRATRKYATVCIDTIRAIAIAELEIADSPKAAIKRVKRKLHQIGGAYQRQTMNYASWLDELRALPDPPARMGVCQRIMAAHASSHERLPYLEQFYACILDAADPPGRVLDVACGLNPLALPWMKLPPETRYDCMDIYADQMSFLQAWLELSDRPGVALWQDALLNPPDARYDLILLLKTIPCLQQIDSRATRRLLANLQAATLVISFPARSLGGRDIGMVAHYGQSFESLLQELAFDATQQLVGDELLYIVSTGK